MSEDFSSLSKMNSFKVIAQGFLLKVYPITLQKSFFHKPSYSVVASEP